MSDELDWITGKIRKEKQYLPSQWMLTDYHNHLKRTGANKRGTQANYLKALRKILLETNYSPSQVQKMDEQTIKQTNRDMLDQIQNSEFRRSNGEDGKRRKRQYWTAWKKLLQIQGFQTDKHNEYMPKFKFSDKKTDEPVTRPEDIPNRNQMKQFLKKLGQKSRPHIALRNQALAILLWDKGPRIGEALSIKIKDINVQGNQLTIRIPGNKKSENRKVPIYQGRKTLKDWIENHPYRDNEDAYLFPIMQKNMPETKMKTNTSLSQKFHQTSNGLDFSTSGEPFHIFRKAMVSSHIVNEWATWEQVCKWHGKKPDSTKPDYLKMLMEDVNQSVAENMGVKQEVIDKNEDHSMLGKPMLPIDCPSCDSLNRCYHETCNSCGNTLPDNQLPNNLEIDEEQEKRAEIKGEVKSLIQMAEQLGVDLDEIEE